MRNRSTFQALVHRRRGVILIMSLWAVGLLGLLAWNLASRARLNIALADYRALAFESELEGRSGLARGLWLIRNDAQVEIDHLGEPWAIPTTPSPPESSDSPETNPQRDAQPEIGIYIKDEFSKVNINLVDRDTLRDILDRYYGFDIQADALADAITDWIDTDENGSYESNADERSGSFVGPRNDAIPVIEELMDIRGVSPWLFFGEDADGNGSLGPEEDDGERTLPVDNEDSVLQLGLRDLFTVQGDGTMNVNTTSGVLLESVLTSIVGLADAKKLVQALNAKRFGNDGVLGTQDDSPFMSRQEIAEIFGAEAWRQIEASNFDFDITTSMFAIGVHVKMPEDGAVYSARGLVARSSNGGTELLSWVSD